MQEMQETIFKLGRKHTSGESLSPITKNDRSGTLHSCSELVSCIRSALRTFFFQIAHKSMPAKKQNIWTPSFH